MTSANSTAKEDEFEEGHWDFGDAIGYMCREQAKIRKTRKFRSSFRCFIDVGETLSTEFLFKPRRVYNVLLFIGRTTNS